MAKRKKKNKAAARMLKGLIVILVLILVGLIGVVVYLGSDEQPPEETRDTTQSTTTAPTDDPTQTTEPLRTGWQDGSYYGPDGEVCTGLTQIDGVTYCLDENGALYAPGWQEIGGSTYYVREDGTPYCGWLELEDGLYYLLPDGTMARGQVEIDGWNWYFTSKGRRIQLVNPWNYVPEGYEADLKELPTKYGNSMKVDASCYDALMQMLGDCTKAGHTVYVVSAYRTQARQEYLYERQVQKQIANGYSRAEAEVVAATISAIPGTSEHQLGLAVDIIDTQIWSLVEEQEDLAGQKWLMEHCWEYGFVLRYPKDKTGVTGIIYEPWHYRYVGTEVAAELHESGLTLEEYIASLS